MQADCGNKSACHISILAGAKKVKGDTRGAVCPRKIPLALNDAVPQTNPQSERLAHLTLSNHGYAR